MTLKKIVSALYILLTTVMAFITVVEKYEGTEYVSTHMYGSWWFSLLWAALVAAGIVYIIRRKLRKWDVVLLHLSFVVILTGALLTHLFSFQGTIHLRIDETTHEYIEVGENLLSKQAKPLPFKIKLNDFDILYHDGSTAVADYCSRITIIDGEHNVDGQVSMNNIMTYGGIRFYQSSYDEDGQGSTLRINSDPWGIPTTYVGYALLFFSLIWLLINPRGTFRKLLKHPLLQKGAVVGILFLFSASTLHAQTTTVLPKEVASRMGELYMLYNDRVCQMQTYAYDFTKKLSGKRSYKGCTPEQVLTGFIFWNDQWTHEPIIKVKGDELKKALHLDSYISLNDLFRSDGYILKQLVEEYYQTNNHDALHEQAVRLDDKVQLIVELRMGNPLRIFPKTTKGKTEWFAPNQHRYPLTITGEENMMMRQTFNHLYQYALLGQNGELMKLVDRTILHQRENAGTSLPSVKQVEAERLYNKYPFATILFMVNLTLGFMALFLAIRRFAKPEERLLRLKHSQWSVLLSVLLGLSFVTLSLTMALRWIISGNIPLSNGYESMLSVAWFVMLITLASNIAWRHLSSLITTFGFMLSGFFLLVSHIGQMDPAIGHIMPVLNSPLLSIHVSVIMMSYALLALTFICGLIGLLMKSQANMLQVLSRIFLYPAIVTMGLGIFIGAIWANISWGTYWSWDPKETWALITFMIYAVVLHTQSFPVFARASTYHWYMVMAFSSIIMTYFGVNYFLGGMHSYA